MLCRTFHIAVSMVATMLLISFQMYGQEATLKIKVFNIQKNTGKIVVEIYNNKSTWLETPLRKVLLNTNEDAKTASFDVPFGNYAVSVYHDVNGNGELDRNFIGIPKEPIGFGNNYKPFGKPKYKSAIIEYKATGKPQEIKLIEAF